MSKNDFKRKTYGNSEREKESLCLQWFGNKRGKISVGNSLKKEQK